MYVYEQEHKRCVWLNVHICIYKYEKQRLVLFVTSCFLLASVRWSLCGVNAQF